MYIGEGARVGRETTVGGNDVPRLAQCFIA